MNGLKIGRFNPDFILIVLTSIVKTDRQEPGGCWVSCFNPTDKAKDVNRENAYSPMTIRLKNARSRSFSKTPTSEVI
jgi:hypothetical protein